MHRAIAPSPDDCFKPIADLALRRMGRLLYGRRMRLAAWFRDRLWRADNWCAELATLRQTVAAEPRSARTSERLFDLAVATEYCDPDRSLPLALYMDAWRGGHAPARDRASVLAGTLHAHMTLAELALAGNELVAAGTAYLDAGFPELAVDPLQRFVDTRPPGASQSSENLRLEGVSALLALGRRTKFDAEREIADSLARAQHATSAAAYVHAERIARLAKLDDRHAAILAAATRAFPDDNRVASLVEARLFDRNDADELLAHYRTRFERTESRAAYVERVRAAGMELLAQGIQPGLGLRLVRMSLEHAYAALLPEVTSHLAAWHLMWMHAQQQRSTLDLVPLIVQALAAPLSEDDAVYLARLGLEIAWRDASDALAAQPYAAMVLDFVPDHPLAVAFVNEVVPDDADPAAAAPEPPPVDVAVAFTSPAPASPPATPPSSPTTPPSPHAKRTSRIPVLEEVPVKRSVSTPSPATQARGISGRLALLTPPPPRETKPKTMPPPRASSLKRDTSPIPMGKRPTTPPAHRAPRKVVPVDVVVELRTGAFFSTVLRDLSTSGAFIVTKRTIEVGAIVSIELRIPLPGKMTQTSYRVNARVARRTDVGWGVAFIDGSRELVASIRATTE